MTVTKKFPFCGSDKQTIKTVWGTEKKNEFCFNAYPVEYAEASNDFKCSECGYECDGEMLWKCPGCGRSIL